MMLLSRLTTSCAYLCRGPKLVTSGGLGGLRLYATRSYRTVGEGVKRKTLQDVISRPTTETPFVVGKLFLAGSAAIGLSALCYYGLGMASEAGIIENATLWPTYVRERVHSTYKYLGGGLLITAASAAMIAKNPALLNFMSRNSLLALFGTMAAVVGTGAMCQSIPYEPGKFGAKQLAWMLHCATLGAIIAPLTILGGPLMLRAACYTGGIVGSLSAIAVCAPNEKFLQMGGLLGMGLGVVFVSCIGTWFLPPTSMLGASLYSVVTYGGLVLFSGFLLYDTQRVIKMAEIYPAMAIRPFDPINAQMGIYLDTINIFMRIAMIMATGSGGANKRR